MERVLKRTGREGRSLKAHHSNPLSHLAQRQYTLLIIILWVMLFHNLQIAFTHISFLIQGPIRPVAMHANLTHVVGYMDSETFC